MRGMTENELLDDLATVNTANWDASWAANNTDAVRAAYDRLVAVLTQYPAMREIVQALAKLESTTFPDDWNGYDYDDVREIVRNARALLGEEDN